MDVLDGPYFVYCKKYLTPFGLWPKQNHKAQLFFRIITFLFFLSACIPHCLELIESISHDFRNYKGESLKILNDYAQQATKVNGIYISYFMIVIFMYNASAFTPLLLDVLIPLNVTRPRRVIRLMKYNIKGIENNFFVISIHGWMFNFIGITFIMGFDTLMLNCTEHACALFRIVTVEVKDAIDTFKDQDETDIETVKKSRNICYQKISKVIINHKRAIEFVDLIESTYAVVNLLVIGITLVSITVAEFETAQHKGETEKMFRYAVHMCGELLHILFHNYPAQRIRDHSLLVYQSCYDCEWYRKDISDACKKLLSLMMLRSQKPSCLTGGGLYVLGLENYATILKASLSYFTFLSSV